VKAVHLGAARTVTRLHVVSGGAVRRVVRGRVMDGSNLSTFYRAGAEMTADASPQDLVGRIDIGAEAVTPPTTVYPTGGQGPYTYSWTVPTYQGAQPVAELPNQATTVFSQLIQPSQVNSATAECLVTDATGRTATTIVVLTFEHTGGGVIP
jgi:hypothetical protein